MYGIFTDIDHKNQADVYGKYTICGWMVWGWWLRHPFEKSLQVQSTVKIAVQTGFVN